MPAFAYHDETLRVPRPLARPRTRELSQQFAPARHDRHGWAWLVLAALVALAVAEPIDIAYHARLSADAQQLLELLGR